MENKIILTEEDSITNALSTVWTDAIKVELAKTVEFSKGLTITDLEDKKQFQIVKDTKNGYVKTRWTIERAFKSKRDEYNKLASDNLVAQREVVWVITDEETRLNDLVKKAELEKLRKDNALKLDDRKEALRKCDHIETDEALLDMIEKDFENLLTDKRLEFVAKEEARIQAEKDRLEREKEIEDAKKQAKLEAEQEAQKKADLEKQKVEQDKVDAENKRLADIEKAKIETKEEMKIEIEEEVEKRVINRTVSPNKTSIPERNKWSEDTAKAIQDKVYEISEQCELNWESCSDMNNRISDYIEKEYLLK